MEVVKMAKNILDKKFQHHSWFKEGVTVGYALDYFAKTNDFTLGKKPSKKQSDILFDEIIYDDILKYQGKERGSYKLRKEEKEYYLQRKEYWNQEKERKEQEWLNSEIDVEKALNNYLCMNSNYDIQSREEQLNYWKYEDKDNEVDKIDFWESEIKRVNITKKIIDNTIKEMKNEIKTNKDFVRFKEEISNRLSKVQYWKGSRHILTAP